MTGTVKRVGDIQTFSSGFTKREVIIEKQDGNFPQVISFNCLKDNTRLLDQVAPGDQVKITFDVRGREWTNPQGVTRVFNDLVCFRLEKVGADGSSVEPAPVADPDDLPLAAPSTDDPLPF